MRSEIVIEFCIDRLPLEALKVESDEKKKTIPLATRQLSWVAYRFGSIRL
jgi:hypothetical protein